MTNQNSIISKNLDKKIDEIKLLLQKGYSVSEISKLLKFGYAAVYNCIQRNNLGDNVSVSQNGKSQTSKNYQKSIQWITCEELQFHYHTLQQNLYDIAKKYNKTAGAVLYTMKKFNITTRTKSEANYILYKNRPELREVHRQNAYNGITGIHIKGKPRKETGIEKRFELFCLENSLYYIKQFQIGGTGHRYDFLVENKILVELDGNYWHNTKKQKQLDESHNKRAEENAFVIVRYTDTEIKKTKGYCFYGLFKFIKRRT